MRAWHRAPASHNAHASGEAHDLQTTVEQPPQSMLATSGARRGHHSALSRISCARLIAPSPNCSKKKSYLLNVVRVSPSVGL